MTWLTEDNSECRRIGHAWDDIKWFSLPRNSAANVLRCTRCTTIRNDIYDALGGLVSRSYIYSEGYQKPRDAHRPYMDELRVFRMKRAKMQKSVTSDKVRRMWSRVEEKLDE